MGGVRAFRPEDIPDLIALRPRVFQLSERDAPQDLAAYWERIFCRYPWPDAELPSLVYQDADSRPVGFIGVIPRRMLFRGQPIRMAVASQMMVAPEHRGLAGLRLARALFAGPQDLTFSDAANDAARVVWTSCGAVEAESLKWERPLRRLRHRGALVVRGPVSRTVLRTIRPLLTAADALAAQLPPEALSQRPPGQLHPIDAATIAAEAPQVLGEFALQPVYGDGALAWLLERAREKRGWGELTGALVRQPDGTAAGWFLHYVHEGETSHVLQVAATRETRALVLRHLFHDAWRRGAIVITGRTIPDGPYELAALGCELRRERPWALFHTPRPEIARAIQNGEVFLSRLEGESWLSF